MSNLIVKNYIAPISLIGLLPILIINTLVNVTDVVVPSIMPTSVSCYCLGSLLVYGYFSIIVDSTQFIGPTNVDGSTPFYADNGFEFWYTTMFLVTLGLFMVPEFSTLFVEHFISYIMTSHIFGILFVTYLYLRDKNYYFDREVDEQKGYTSLFKFYRGLNFHPTFLGVDVKQLTNCRVGMISWQIIIMLFAHFYFTQFGFNIAIFSTVLLQTIYIAKFFYWETGYFNTLDITLDRAGFYICWGCLVFIPSFYTFTVYTLINSTIDIPILNGLLIMIGGLLFTYLNYIVDYQKELFKKHKKNLKLNGERVSYLPVKYTVNGIEKQSNLLLSGYWGISRHMNYTFEILMSLCWSLPGYSLGVIPFLYVFYITILLVHRIYRDESKCKKKYGHYWDKYCKLVNYRLLKYIY